MLFSTSKTSALNELASGTLTVMWHGWKRLSLGWCVLLGVHAICLTHTKCAPSEKQRRESMDINTWLQTLEPSEAEEMKEFLRQPNVMLIDDVDEIVPAIKQFEERKNAH